MSGVTEVDERDRWLSRITAKRVFVFVGVVWLAWALSMLILSAGAQALGLFGDSFGALNALFSGLAFGGVIYAIVLQRSELELQRQELTLTREELKRTAEANEASCREAVKARCASAFFQIMTILDELRPHWHRLYDLPSDFRQWDDSQRSLADHVGTELQRVAYLCLSGFLDTNYVIDGWGKVFIRCWNKLSAYIADYRVQCGEPAELCKGGYQRKHFEQFTRCCAEYFPGWVP